jgi:hypothetical protein
VALKEALGDPIKNVVSSEEIFGDKKLIDHEQMIKDVCTVCNSNLSSYDIAGRNLIAFLKKNKYSKSLEVEFNKDLIGWIIKTHLNFIRLIKDREWRRAYPIKQKIKNSLAKNKELDISLFGFYARIWEENSNLWNAENPKAPYFYFNSIRFRKQKVYFSHFRVRQLDTALYFPVDKNYKNFDKRVSSVNDEIKETFGQTFQEITLENTGLNSVKINHLYPLNRILEKIDNSS